MACPDNDEVVTMYWLDVSRTSGDEGIRTPDPLLARQVLSQLSYTPIYHGFVRNRGGENELVRFFLIHCFF